MPSLSVIMPIFNGAETLERALASMVDQAGEVHEVIAVDQASHDGSREILERFADRLPIRIHDAPESRSWMTNVNIGLYAACGTLATMLHQDDIWYPGRAARLRALAREHPETALFVHTGALVDLEDRPRGRMAPPFGSQTRSVSRDEALALLCVQNTIALPAAAFRTKDALRSGGLSEDLWYTADWDLWLRLASASGLVWTPETLAGFRIHGNSQTARRSADLEAFEAQMLRAVEPYLNTLAPESAPQIRRLSLASTSLNVLLAGVYHRQRVTPWRFLSAFVGLGPVGWVRFFSRTQIVARLLPRLRLLLRTSR